jgi:hypothetical protein
MKVVSPRHRLPLPPGNIPGTHLRGSLNWLLSSHNGWNDYANKRFQWNHREFTALSHRMAHILYILTHTHTHTHAYIYIYIYIYPCVCQRRACIFREHARKNLSENTTARKIKIAVIWNETYCRDFKPSEECATSFFRIRLAQCLREFIRSEFAI